MGNFSQVSVGDGNLKLNGVDAGFIRNVTLNRNLEQLKLETGSPRKLQGSLPIREEAFLTADFLELSMTNFSRFLGLPLTVEVGSTITINDAANQERTFAASGNYDGALERIILDGPGVGALVIKNVAESTTYVAGTDYLLDGSGRGVIRLAGGAITSGQTVRVSYTYTPVAATRIKGGENYTLSRFSLEFRHPKYGSNTDLVWHHSIVEPSPSFASNFNDQDFIINNVRFDHIYDASKAAAGNSLFTLDEVARGAIVSA